MVVASSYSIWLVMQEEVTNHLHDSDRTPVRDFDRHLQVFCNLYDLNLLDTVYIISRLEALMQAP